MANYTTVADGNGDFAVSFSSSYTSGEKITVTAEVSGATKSIELFAPSETVSGSNNWIAFTISTGGYPTNIAMSTTGSIPNDIPANAFYAQSGNIFSKARSLTIPNTITSIGDSAFRGWGLVTSLVIPDSVVSLGEFVFQNWTSATSLIVGNGVTSIKTACFESWISATSLTIGSSVADIYDYAFFGWSSLLEMTVLRATPPTITSTTFSGLKASCVIKVPAASLNAYKTAPNWSAHASKMVGV